MCWITFRPACASDDQGARFCWTTQRSVSENAVTQREDFMHCLRCAVIGIYLAFALLGHAGAQTATKTGEFDITFNERSPLSAKAEVLKRLGEKNDEPD